MEITIEESGVTFGPFSSDNCYQIEHSAGHRSVGDNIKIAEFVVLTDNGKKLWLIEAKSSFSKPDNRTDYEKNIREIEDKLTNTLTLVLMGCLQRQPVIQKELPESIRDIDWSSLNIQLRLVIPDFPQTWLIPITDKLRQTMGPLLQMWKINKMNLKASNKALAQQERLILPDN